MLLSKDKILSAEDLPFEDVEVQEWGGTVRLRTMTGLERDAFEQSVIMFEGKTRKMNMINIRAKLVAKTAVDESGNPLFAEGDIEKLGKKSAKALDKLFGIAQKLNGIGQDDIEALAKN